jgi:hypothetical protein
VTRKDFVLLAEALKESKPPQHDQYDAEGNRFQQWDVDVQAIGVAIQKEHTGFDISWFYENCGISD